MKGILLLAALHILIIYQSQKKHSNVNNIIPEPASIPAVVQQTGSDNTSLLPAIQGHPGFLSAFYYGSTRKFTINPVAGF